MTNEAPQLNQQITAETTLEDFMLIAETVVSERLKSLLGEEAVKRLGSAILSAATFGTVSFDMAAYRAICVVDAEGQPLLAEAADEVVAVSESIGLFADLGDGRLLVQGEALSENLNRLLEDYESQENI